MSAHEILALRSDTTGRSLTDTQDVSHDENTTAYNLCIQDNTRLPCTDESPISRSVEIKGLYDKRTGLEIVGCNTGTDQYTLFSTSYQCNSDRPKELVFCVRTVSTVSQGSDVSLCGALTNFEQ